MASAVYRVRHISFNPYAKITLDTLHLAIYMPQTSPNPPWASAPGSAVACQPHNGSSSKRTATQNHSPLIRSASKALMSTTPSSGANHATSILPPQDDDTDPPCKVKWSPHTRPISSFNSPPPATNGAHSAPHQAFVSSSPPHRKAPRQCPKPLSTP